MGEGAEQRITIVLREAAEGEKPLGCISWKRIGGSVWPSPPFPARPLRGEYRSAHTAGAASKIPFYISKSSSLGERPPEGQNLIVRRPPAWAPPPPAPELSWH